MDFFTDFNEEETEENAAPSNIEEEKDYSYILSYAEGYKYSSTSSDTSFAANATGELPLSVEVDLQAAASVLCFLVLVAVLCGWFDGWMTRNREANRFTTYTHPIRQAQWELASLWRSEELELLHASAHEGSQGTQQHQAQQDRQEVAEESPQPVPEVAQNHGLKESKREPDSEGTPQTLSSVGHSST